MSSWARSFAACSVWPAISILAASCASRVGEGEKAVARPESREESAGEPSKSEIRATLEAFAAEKRAARKHLEQGNRDLVRGVLE